MNCFQNMERKRWRIEWKSDRDGAKEEERERERDFRVGLSHSRVFYSRQGTIGWVRQIHKRHLENEIMLRVWAPMRSTTTAAAVVALLHRMNKKKIIRRQTHTHTYIYTPMTSFIGSTILLSTRSILTTNGNKWFQPYHS